MLVDLDEDALEQAYWDFKADAEKGGMERDAFKRHMRGFARVTKRESGVATLPTGAVEAAAKHVAGMYYDTNYADGTRDEYIARAYPLYLPDAQACLQAAVPALVAENERLKAMLREKNVVFIDHICSDPACERCRPSPEGA